MKNTLTPGIITQDTGSLDYTKEHIRIDQLIPSDILADKEKLRDFLEAYYTFMNMDEFIYQETKTFTDVILDSVARFRIPDPTGELNEFFTDDDGANSTLTLTSPTGFSPKKQIFDASSSSIVHLGNDTINVGDFFQKAAPIGTLLTYDVGDGTAIGGLVDDQNYYVVESAGGLIKLSTTSGGSAINLTSLGSGVIHSFKGASSTMTIPLANTNVQISNGNDLPGTLADSTSEIGKTFTVSGLSSFNGYSASITTIVKSWVGPGPSNVMNTIEKAMNIDENAKNYLELMQKEIAEAIPRNASTNKRNLYKRMVDFYKLRGTTDSIEIFFRLLFDDEVEVEFPYNQTLIPSEGDWNQDADITSVVNGAVNNSKTINIDATDENIRAGATLIFGTTYKLADAIRVTDVQGRVITVDTNVTLADNAVITFRPRGAYLDSKGQLSHNNKLQDSDKYQKFSYLIKTGLNLSDWERAFDKLVHPAGFKYFAEILIFLQLVDAELTAALNRASMPSAQPGVIGPEDIPLLVEIFLSQFLPATTVNVHKSGTLSLALKNGVISGSAITDGGSGYLTGPAITTSDAATASGFTAATLTTTVAAGALDSITITNGGQDYGDPQGTVAAPAAIQFDGSDDEVAGTGIVNTTDNTIKLTAPQAAALPINSKVKYLTTGTAIGGLVSGNFYYIVFNTSNEVKLSSTQGGSVISLTGVGVGTNHSFTGETATVTFTKTDGKVKSIEIGEKGFGYTGSQLSVVFSGTAQQGVSQTTPVATIGLTSKGELDKDDINITNEGGGWAQLFATVAANSNATKIHSVDFTGPINKRFKTSPEIVFPEPTAKDAEGNLLSSNVKATGVFTIATADDFSDSENPIYKGEITAANITNVGSGYVTTPFIRIASAVQNEERVKETKEILILSLNHHMTNIHNGFNYANFKTIINNSYKQRKGQTFYNTPRLYNSNQKISFLGDIQIQNVDSTNINKYNTRTFVDIE